MRAAVLPLLVLASGLAASCGTRNEMAIVTDAGSSDAGPSWCPPEPSAHAVCPAGIQTCMYWATRTTCGTNFCPCAAATVGTSACGGTAGCMVPTDNLLLCAPGGDCNEGTGCVVQECGRSCLCGADKKWRCASDRC